MIRYAFHFWQNDYSNSLGYTVIVLRFFTITGKHVSTRGMENFHCYCSHYPLITSYFLLDIFFRHIESRCCSIHVRLSYKC